MSDLPEAIRAKLAADEEKVCVELSHDADVAYLSSSEARVIAADLVAHADALDELTGKSTGA